MTSRYLDFKFKKWGDKRYTMQHYRVMHLNEEVAVAIRHGNSNPNWYVIPTGWSKGIEGLRSREAVVQFLRQFYVDDPWYDDPGTKGYSEYSTDGTTWTRQRPPGKVRMRYVGVSLSIELTEKTDE